MSLGSTIALIKTLASNGGSSGRGVLVVHEVGGTLDKIWQEIKDATKAGSLIILLSINPAASSYKYFWSAGYSAFGTENWDVTFFANNVTIIYKTTNDANDYPVFEETL